MIELEFAKGYFIDENGKVYSNKGKGQRNKNKTVPLYELKPRFCKNGYCRVYLTCNDGNRKDFYIHRLVAKYFVSNPNGYKYVDHINFNRCDNRAINLQWLTSKQNTERTLIYEHCTRNDKGQFVSAFDYKSVLNIV